MQIIDLILCKMKKGKVETERFNTDEKYLAAKMFVCTNSGQYALSVNCMPDFLEHLKERLTEE